MLSVSSKTMFKKIQENPKSFSFIDLSSLNRKIPLSLILRFITKADSEVKRVVINKEFGAVDIQKYNFSGLFF